jgi:hypothetical protein
MGKIWERLWLGVCLGGFLFLISFVLVSMAWPSSGVSAFGVACAAGLGGLVGGFFHRVHNK